MFTIKSHCNQKKLFAFTLILCIIFCSLFGTSAFAETDENNIIDTHAVPIPIDEYILVTMEHEYSFPKEDYDASYFGIEYVKEVEAIFTYQEGDFADPETFLRIEQLFLTDYGKENIDAFIELLKERDDIFAAEKDYLFPNVSAAEGLSELNEIPEGAEAIDEYILVSMEHEYSFPKEDYEPSYFGKEFRAVRLAKGYLMGDSNLDGVIDPSDARQVLRWSIGFDNCTDLNEALCDVDYDNSITPEDARLVLQMAVGSIDPIQ